MTLLIAQIAPWLSGALVILFLFICILLILAVLIQRPAGGGLSGAFGSGAGSGQTAFGAKTGDALTLATIAIFVVYILFAIGLNFAARPGGAMPGNETTATVPPAPTAPESGTLPPNGEAALNFEPAPATTPSTPPAGEQPVQPTTPESPGPGAQNPENPDPAAPLPTPAPAPAPQPPPGG